MRDEDWFLANHQRLLSRTSFQRDLKQGIVHTRPKSMHQLRVERRGDQVQLYFYGTDSREVLSRMDVRDPLNLVAPYTQAMILALVWCHDPKLAYMVGFGAGRVPMVLHHYLPGLYIESTELDEDVVDVAQSYFGIELDDRLRVAIEDGRRYLEERTNPTNYDMIFVDAFRGTGSSPFLLSTTQFYELCKRHLSQNGVFVANLLQSDPLYNDKLTTVAASFRCTHLVSVGYGASVVFGSQRDPVPTSEFVAKAKQLQERHRFGFRFLDHVDNVQFLAERGELLDATYQGWMLMDGTPPRDLPLPESAAVRTRRDDPCPCGSGRDFGSCHGSATKRRV